MKSNGVALRMATLPSKIRSSQGRWSTKRLTSWRLKRPEQMPETDNQQQRRNSRALIPPLRIDPIERAKAEVRNGLLQYDMGIEAVLSALDRIDKGNTWKLRPSLILGLQRRALEGISSFAGSYRPGAVKIEMSSHVPPGAHLVPELLEDLCDYVNENWHRTAIHLAAYILWRLNWIHPFDDGNGRTSRIVSYIVLLVKIGRDLGGSPTITDLIVEHRSDYFAALDAADTKLRKQIMDVGAMEALLSSLLAKQLTSIYKEAGGTITEDIQTR